MSGTGGVTGNESRQVMEAQAIQRALVRIAHEVVERNKGVDGLALIGVRSRGVHLAQRLRRALQEIAGGPLVPFGVVDITLYRDDLDRGSQTPRVQRTDIAFPIEGQRIVLVDDVLFTGRTIRAAMDALVDFGRPAVDPARGPDRPRPSRAADPADYVGKTSPRRGTNACAPARRARRGGRGRARELRARGR